jgi:replicative DNA helicase
VNQTFCQDDFDLPAHKAILLAATTVAGENYEAVRNNPNEEIAYEFLVSILAGLVQSGELTENEIPDVEDALDLVYDVTLCPQLLEGRISGFIESQRVREEINRNAAAGQIANTASFLDRLNQISEDALGVNTQNQQRSFTAMTHALTSLPTEDGDMLTTGLDSLDAMMGGGVKRKKSGMICAYTGFGKSAYGLQICRKGAEQGSVCRFSTHEMTREECMNRFLSAFLQYDYGLIWKGDQSMPVEARRTREEINDEVARLFAARLESNDHARLCAQNFGIWDFHDVSCTVEMLERQLVWERENGTPVDILVIDYIDKLVLPNTEAFSVENQDRRVALGKISQQIEELAIKMDMVIWSLTQANDEGRKKNYPTLTSTRDSKLKNDPCSFWFGLGGTEQKRERERTMTVRCDKNRDGPTFNIEIRTDLATQRFLDFEAGDAVGERISNPERRDRFNPGQPMSLDDIMDQNGGT